MVRNKPIKNFASIKHGYAFSSQYFSKDKQDYILLTPGNFHIDKKLYFGSNTKYYSGPIDSDYVLSNGDLLVVMTDLTKDMAILGNAVILHSELPVLHNQRIGLIDTSSDVSKEYLCYLINSESVKRYIKATASGTTVRHTSPSKILDIRAYFPPLPEQQKIAKILTTWDKAIDTTERLIDNSKQQKKALMQQLLTGKKRLLGDNGERFEGEWKLSNFSKVFEVANNKNSQVKSSDYLESGNTPIVDQGKMLVSGYTNKQDIYSDTPVIIFGDHTRVVKWVNFSFCQGADGTQVLKPNNVLEAKFAYYLLSHTPIPNLGYSRHMRELKEKSFKYPIDKLEQQKIAAVLTNADKEIELLEQQLADLQQEEKALMQVLLTGKKRVVVDEEVKA